MPLARHDIAKSFKYLGIWFNPKGGWKKQYEVCIAHAENFSGKIKASYLNTHEIHTAYSSIWRAKIRYILQHVWSTRNQCATIQSIVLSSILPRLHINRNCPRALIHGGIKYGGFNIPTHYHEQGSLMIQYLLCKLRKNDAQAKLIRISIKNLQLEYGSATVILGKVPSIPQYITKTWVTNAWEFLHNENLYIRIPNIHQQEIQRANDTYLMDIVQNMPTTKIRQFNKCRIYL